MAPSENVKRLAHLGRVSSVRMPGKGYSAFVRILRMAFPIFAVGILAVLFTWPGMEKTREAMGPEGPMLPETGQNQLIKPRYESADRRQQPYTVTADQAVQDTQDPDSIVLENPVADMLLQNGSWIAIQAQTGRYRQEKQTLALESDVQLYYDDGYRMTTDALEIDFSGRSAHSSSAVQVQGAEGTLDAAGLDARLGADRLVFRGPVRMLLYKGFLPEDG